MPANADEEDPEEKEPVSKAKTLIDDLLAGKPKDQKKYNISRSKELIQDIMMEASLPKEIEKKDDEDSGLPSDCVPFA